MPILDSAQRERLTPEERKRVGELISDYVRGVLTKETSVEFDALIEKAGKKQQ